MFVSSTYFFLLCSPISRALFDYLPTAGEQRAGNLSFHEGDVVEVCMLCMYFIVPCVSDVCTVLCCMHHTALCVFCIAVYTCTKLYVCYACICVL